MCCFPAAPAKGDVLSYRDRPSSHHGGEIPIYGGVVSSDTIFLIIIIYAQNKGAGPG